MSLELKTSVDGDIASGVAHWIDNYSSKTPRFLHDSKVTLGNEIVGWRFGTEQYTIKFRVKTETLAFYEAIIGYHANGTQFRMNNTKDLGDLMLKTIPGECTFKRLEDISLIVGVVYEMFLSCTIVTEDI